MNKKNRSQYHFKIDGDILAIVDDNVGKSVTNDIENVLTDLVSALGDIRKYHIIYRDSMDQWDSIILDKEGGIYTSILNFQFGSIGVKDYDEAKSIIKNKKL
jgi:hypothetical protein